MVLVFICLNAYAVDYDCDKIALKEMVSFIEYGSVEKFQAENAVILFCKSKKTPDHEIFQWGNGHEIFGMEFNVIQGKCIVIEGPYIGYDDGYQDIQGIKEYCQ